MKKKETKGSWRIRPLFDDSRRPQMSCPRSSMAITVKEMSCGVCCKTSSLPLKLIKAAVNKPNEDWGFKATQVFLCRKYTQLFRTTWSQFRGISILSSSVKSDHFCRGTNGKESVSKGHKLALLMLGRRGYGSQQKLLLVGFTENSKPFGLICRRRSHTDKNVRLSNVVICSRLEKLPFLYRFLKSRRELRGHCVRRQWKHGKYSFLEVLWNNRWSFLHGC